MPFLPIFLTLNLKGQQSVVSDKLHSSHRNVSQPEKTIIIAFLHFQMSETVFSHPKRHETEETGYHTILPCRYIYFPRFQISQFHISFFVWFFFSNSKRFGNSLVTE